LKLPVNLKERLKAYLSPEELLQLELDDENNSNETTKQAASNTIHKLPVFQPTAAAAMMYQIQSTSQQLQKEKQLSKMKRPELTLNNLYVNQHLAKKSPVVEGLERPISGGGGGGGGGGRVSSGLIANILKKDTEDFSKKSYKLLPYICLRCKKDVVLCDSPTQTNPNDLDESNCCLKVKFASQVNPFSSNTTSTQFLRSKTIGSNMSKMTHHQKNASADLSNVKIVESNTNDDVFSSATSGKYVYSKKDKDKARVDSWADLDSVSTVV